MKGTPWLELQLVDEGQDGERHYLEGRAVHAGEAIELQHVEHDADGSAEYLQAGTVVRYEAKWGGVGRENAIRFATIHLGYGGHEFAVRVEPWMRFRWPPPTARGEKEREIAQLVELLHTSTAGELRRALGALPVHLRARLYAAVGLAREERGR